MFLNSKIQFSIVLFIVSFSQIFAQTTLQYNVKPQDKFAYSVSADINQSFSQMGQETNVNMKMTSDLDIKITNVTKNITMQMKYIQPMISMSGMEAMGVADTTIDASSQLDFKMEYEFTKNGSILSYKIVEEKTIEMDQQAKMMKQQVTSQLKQSTDFLIYQYPTKSLKIGDTWNTNDTVDVNGIKTVRNFVHTLQAIKKENGNDVAEIITKSTNISVNGTTNQMGMEMEVRGGVTINAYSKVDVKTGLVQNMEMTNNSDITMSMSSPMEMTIPITLKMVTKLSKK
jgi:hypothetical protein